MSEPIKMYDVYINAINDDWLIVMDDEKPMWMKYQSSRLQTKIDMAARFISFRKPVMSQFVIHIKADHIIKMEIQFVLNVKLPYLQLAFVDWGNGDLRRRELFNKLEIP